MKKKRLEASLSPPLTGSNTFRSSGKNSMALQQKSKITSGSTFEYKESINSKLPELGEKRMITAGSIPENCDLRYRIKMMKYQKNSM